MLAGALGCLGFGFGLCGAIGPDGVLIGLKGGYWADSRLIRNLLHVFLAHDWGCCPPPSASAPAYITYSLMQCKEFMIHRCLPWGPAWGLEGVRTEPHVQLSALNESFGVILYLHGIMMHK